MDYLVFFPEPGGEIIVNFAAWGKPIPPNPHPGVKPVRKYNTLLAPNGVPAGPLWPDVLKTNLCFRPSAGGVRKGSLDTHQIIHSHT